MIIACKLRQMTYFRYQNSHYQFLVNPESHAVAVPEALLEEYAVSYTYSLSTNPQLLCSYGSYPA